MRSPLDVELLEGRLGREPALEVALASVLLESVARGHRGPVLRCYRPPRTVAFGQRDAFLAGFASAAGAARTHGFAPVSRAPGGRAAAYDEGCLVLDEIMPAEDSLTGIRDRFAREAERQAQALRGLGIDARVGEVPGEYCPGAFTVNAGGRKKLIGAAQRAVPGGWLLSSVVVIDSAARVRGVLESVYDALELHWDPATVGAASARTPPAWARARPRDREHYVINTGRQDARHASTFAHRSAERVVKTPTPLSVLEATCAVS